MGSVLENKTLVANSLTPRGRDEISDTVLELFPRVGKNNGAANNKTSRLHGRSRSGQNYSEQSKGEVWLAGVICCFGRQWNQTPCFVGKTGAGWLGGEFRNCRPGARGSRLGGVVHRDLVGWGGPFLNTL